MSLIKKTTLIITILHPSEDEIGCLPLEDIASEINNGFSVGQVRTVSTEDVPLGQVVAELRAVGNDGSFFEDYLDGAANGCGGPNCSIEIDTAGDRFCTVCGLGWGNIADVAEGEAMSFTEAMRATQGDGR